MSFLIVLLFTLSFFYLFLHLGFCEAYQNSLVALIKITTVYKKTYITVNQNNEQQRQSFREGEEMIDRI